MLVTDCKEFVDWRDAVPDNIDEKIAEVKKRGGMVGLSLIHILNTVVTLTENQNAFFTLSYFFAP